MDTNKLDVLLKVVKIGSLKKAAEELNYTQSGLIYMMNTLEQELSIQLLNRTPKGVVLSPEGEHLLPLINELVWSEARLMDEIGEMNKSTSRKLRIAAYPIYARYYLPEVIHNYMADYPDDMISIRVGTEEDMPKWLNAGMVDIAIGEVTMAGSGKFTPLIEDEVYVAIPESYNIEIKDGFSMSDIGDYPILFSNYNPVSKLVQEQSNGELKNRIDVTSKDGSALLSMVEEELGIAFLSKLYSYECPAKIKMYPLNPPVMRQLGVIIDDSEHISHMIRRFIPYLEKVTKTQFEKHSETY